MKWFKHDTDSLRNRKVRKVIRTHGPTGYAIWFALLEKLYETEDEFQVKADELWLEDLADDLKISDYRTLIRVFDTFAEVGLISSQLWQGEHILYCEAIAERGDAYMEKRIKETQKKRNQRARKKELSPGDKMGTRGQKPDVPPADVRFQSSNLDTDLGSIEQTNNLNTPLYPPDDFEEEWGEGEVLSKTANTSSQPQHSQPDPKPLRTAPSRSCYEYGNKAQQMDHLFGGNRFPWTGDDRFVEWLVDNWPWTSDPEKRSLKLSSRRDWLRKQERAWNLESIEDKWSIYQSERGTDAIASEDIKTSIGRELRRLNLSSELPADWRKRTGKTLASELSSSDAAAYLSHLRSQEGAA